MPDLLKRGSFWLDRQRKLHASEERLYVRGDRSLIAAASKGKSTFDVAEASGVMTRLDTTDWLIAAEDLTLDGVRLTPRPGDRIIEGELASGVVYEVMGIPGGDCWRWSDNHRRTLRIHTKLATKGTGD